MTTFLINDTKGGDNVDEDPKIAARLDEYGKGVVRCLRLIVERIDAGETINDACLDDVSDIADWDGQLAELRMTPDEFVGFAITMAAIEQVMTVDRDFHFEHAESTDRPTTEGQTEVPK
jgi:hypothetical protein